MAFYTSSRLGVKCLLDMESIPQITTCPRFEQDRTESKTFKFWAEMLFEIRNYVIGKIIEICYTS